MLASRIVTYVTMQKRSEYEATQPFWLIANAKSESADPPETVKNIEESTGCGVYGLSPAAYDHRITRMEVLI